MLGASEEQRVENGERSTNDKYIGKYSCFLTQALAGNEPQAIRMQSLMDLSAKMVARHWTLEAIEQAATQVLRL